MKNIASVCLLSLLLVVGCSKSPQDEDQQVESESPADTPVSSGEPITLHARLDFMDSSISASVNANRKLNASIYIETDATREGSGASATYTLDSDARIQGALTATGTLALKSDEVSSNETYNMRNEWNTLTDKPDGMFSIKDPEASRIGEGLSVAVEIEAPVSGIKKTVMTTDSQTVDSKEVTLSRPMFCSSQPVDKDKDICKLKFTIDAIPTKVQTPELETMLESAKTLYTYQGKKNPEGGLVMYSSLVPVYGATTQYHDGHFVTALDQEYTANIDGTDIGQHIYLVVWSTKRGDNWQPDGLTPLQKPDAMP